MLGVRLKRDSDAIVQLRQLFAAVTSDGCAFGVVKPDGCASLAGTQSPVAHVSAHDQVSASASSATDTAQVLKHGKHRDAP